MSTLSLSLSHTQTQLEQFVLFCPVWVVPSFYAAGESHIKAHLLRWSEGDGIADGMNPYGAFFLFYSFL